MNRELPDSAKFERLLCRVVEPSGRVYSVFTTGRIEGFEAGSRSFNFYPGLLAQALAYLEGEIVKTFRSSKSGSWHSSPPCCEITNEATTAANGEKK